MNDFWILISLLSIGLILILIQFYQDIKNNPDDPYKKGLKGELFVIDTLNNWAKNNNLNAIAYQYETPEHQIQKIDVLLKSTNGHNIGIEVKFRNTQHLNYLKMEQISRFHKNGNRQSTKQFNNYILPNNLLGLYAFVFQNYETTNLYFLPHYIIEKMILTGKTTIRIDEIKSHPHTYEWYNDPLKIHFTIQNHNNQKFLDYIEKEFNNQNHFTTISNHNSN
jgi:hypothetical protein